MKLKQNMITVASALLLASGMAAAQTSTDKAMNEPHRGAASVTTPSGKVVPVRERDAAMKGEKDMLERKLQAATSRADYAKILESNGYRVSAINADKKDYLEYEVVKGKHSYEVQLDFDNASAKATKIDVTTNLWRADATKRMLKEPNYKHTGTLAADPEGRYSDRRFMKAWTDEKELLEKSLPLNLPAADYKSKIEQMGYKITAVNENKKDYVEYEIAKGDNSYEVQINLDPKTRMAKEIDVTNNLWEAEATDRATSRKK